MKRVEHGSINKCNIYIMRENCPWVECVANELALVSHVIIGTVHIGKSMDEK